MRKTIRASSKIIQSASGSPEDFLNALDNQILNLEGGITSATEPVEGVFLDKRDQYMAKTGQWGRDDDPEPGNNYEYKGFSVHSDCYDGDGESGPCAPQISFDLFSDEHRSRVDLTQYYDETSISGYNFDVLNRSEVESVIDELIANGYTTIEPCPNCADAGCVDCVGEYIESSSDILGSAEEGAWEYGPFSIREYDGKFNILTQDGDESDIPPADSLDSAKYEIECYLIEESLAGYGLTWGTCPETGEEAGIGGVPDLLPGYMDTKYGEGLDLEGAIEQWIQDTNDNYPGFLVQASEEVTASYKYITTHGIGPGTLPKDVELLEVVELPAMKSELTLNRELTPEELSYYDLRCVRTGVRGSESNSEDLVTL
jgi:hypothetical protein